VFQNLSTDNWAIWTVLCDALTELYLPFIRKSSSMDNQALSAWKLRHCLAMNYEGYPTFNWWHLDPSDKLCEDEALQSQIIREALVKFIRERDDADKYVSRKYALLIRTLGEWDLKVKEVNERVNLARLMVDDINNKRRDEAYNRIADE